MELAQDMKINGRQGSKGNTRAFSLTVGSGDFLHFLFFSLNRSSDLTLSIS